MRSEKVHSLQYEICRIVILGVAVLCVVFAVTMFLEQRVLINMRETVDNNKIFSEYYESVRTASAALTRYINTGQYEDRNACIRAEQILSQNNHKMERKFDDPQFRDNYYLTQNYLHYYNQITMTQETDEEKLMDSYTVCQKIWGYLLENENELNSVMTELTFEIYQEQYVMWKRQFILIAVFIVLGSSYLLLISKSRVHRLTAPLTELTEQMQNMKNGEELSFREQGIFVTETKILKSTFQEMNAVIRQQMQELVEKMKLDEEIHNLQLQNVEMKNSLNEAHLNLIQSLLSPHFLFNCLNTVSGLAYFEQAEKTREASQLIACYLRDSIHLIGQNITLKEEIQHTKEYMEIQKLRFRERISFYIQDENTDGNVEVPSMILQPLVENAVSHGLRSVWEGGEVHIYVETKEKEVVLQVRDNGEGVSSQELESIRKRLEQLKKLEIQNELSGKTAHATSVEMTGLYGVAVRLWAIYGEKASVQIGSIQGKETKVKLKIKKTAT